MRLEVINAESSLNVSDCWGAAGFIRHLVWGKLHHAGGINRHVIILNFQSNGPGDLVAIDAIYYAVFSLYVRLNRE